MRSEFAYGILMNPINFSENRIKVVKKKIKFKKI